MIALHACLLAGAAAVPIDLRLTSPSARQRMPARDIVVANRSARAAASGLGRRQGTRRSR